MKSLFLWTVPQDENIHFSEIMFSEYEEVGSVLSVMIFSRLCWTWSECLVLEIMLSWGLRLPCWLFTVMVRNFSFICNSWCAQVCFVSLLWYVSWAITWTVAWISRILSSWDCLLWSRRVWVVILRELRRPCLVQSMFWTVLFYLAELKAVSPKWWNSESVLPPCSGYFATVILQSWGISALLCELYRSWVEWKVFDTNLSQCCKTVAAVLSQI